MAQASPLRARSRPGRFERTLVYCKELRVVGSTAFGAETFRGVRKPARARSVDLCAVGEMDLAWLVTHRYPLEEWQAAFSTAIAKRTGCVKVAFAFADAAA